MSFEILPGDSTTILVLISAGGMQDPFFPSGRRNPICRDGRRNEVSFPKEVDAAREGKINRSADAPGAEDERQQEAPVSSITGSVKDPFFWHCGSM